MENQQHNGKKWYVAFSHVHKLHISTISWYFMLQVQEESQHWAAI